MFIYLITNQINGKKYVGQTIESISKRFQRHCWACTHNMAITSAIKKYGKENFSIKVLEICNSIEELNLKEQEYITTLNTLSPNGYNLTTGGKNKKLSQETKDKISKSNTGKIRSEETKKKLSLSHKGYKVKESTKQKLSQINKGKQGTNYCYQRLKETSQKTYYFLSPDNQPIVIVNMREFCKLHKLSAPKMCLVNQGIRNHHKGWKKHHTF